MTNKTINGYTLQHKLGEGGMAEVWYAENVIGRKAAVKIMHAEFVKNAQIVARFENEAKVMIKLEHSNIRAVYDYALVDEKPCIIMEYLEGEDLSDRLKKGTSASLSDLFSETDIRKWWNQIVDALNYTHAQGIVHRDIKPSNLFVTTQGEIKLLDFGIAKIDETGIGTLTGSQMGTPVYMSPEQVKSSKHVDYRTDIYSLAVTFFHLLTGKAPYDVTTDSMFEIQTKIVQEPLCLGKLPVEWQGFLKPFLAKDAAQRAALQPFSETAAGRDAARHVSTGTTTDDKTIIEQPIVPQSPTSPESETPTNPPTTQPPTRNKKNKGDKKGVIYGIVAFLVTAVLVGGFFWWNNDDNTQFSIEKLEARGFRFYSFDGSKPWMEEERDVIEGDTSNGLVLFRKLDTYYLAYFLNEKIAFPFLRASGGGNFTTMLAVQEHICSYACVWLDRNEVSDRPMCEKLGEIFGNHIFTAEFITDFHRGIVDLATLEQNFHRFITSGGYIAMDTFECPDVTIFISESLVGLSIADAALKESVLKKMAELYNLRFTEEEIAEFLTSLGSVYVDIRELGQFLAMTNDERNAQWDSGGGFSGVPYCPHNSQLLDWVRVTLQAKSELGILPLIAIREFYADASVVRMVRNMRESELERSEQARLAAIENRRRELTENRQREAQ